MAKRQSKTASGNSASENSGKVRFEVRFDEDVYQGVKKIADEAQISVNQLMHALARWATQNAKAGEPKLNHIGMWMGETKPQPGTVTIGVPGTFRTMHHAELRYEAGQQQMSIEDYAQLHGDQSVAFNGKTWTFDFTERRVIREDV